MQHTHAPIVKPNAANFTQMLEAHVKDLAKATDRARISDEMNNWVAFCSRFYHYSPGNQMLIFWQKPDAVQVAGYNAWLKMHRFVKKGEKGIAILAPCPYQREDPADPKKTYSGIYFKIAYVFDVSQTDGEPIPESPAWTSPERLPVLEAKLFDFCTAHNIKVDRQVLTGAQGYSTGGSIVLDENAGTKTLIHEIAHELLHHTAAIRPDRETGELQAECIAYVVGIALGLPCAGSPNYLAIWAADSKKIMDNLHVIQKTAAVIIEYVQSSDPQ